MKLPAPAPLTPDEVKERQREKRAAKDRIAKRRMRNDTAARGAARTAAERGVGEGRIDVEVAERRYRDTLTKNVRDALQVAMSVERQEHRVPVNFTMVSKAERPGEHAEHTDLGRVGVSAYTDFSQIVIKVAEGKFPSLSTLGAGAFLSSIRGLFHHEAGHIIYTIPLKAMADGLENRTDPKSRALDDRLSKVTGLTGFDRWMRIHTVWNVLEDQRMESARVRDFTAAGSYLTTMVADFLLDDREEDFYPKSWYLLAGRTYLPRKVRSMSFNGFEHGVLLAQRWNDIVVAYKAADNENDMLSSILDACEFLMENEESCKGEDGCFSPGEGSEGETVDGHDGLISGDANGDPSDKAARGSTTGKADDSSDLISAGKGEGEDSHTTRHFTDEVRRMRVESVSKQDTATARGAREDATRVGLPVFDSNRAQPMRAELVGTAHSLARDVQRALETYVTTGQPTWVHRQEDGYLDPLAYRSREPGERDYHVGMSGEQRPTLDVHVSVMVDVSGSMMSHMEQTSVCMLAMRMACDELNVPSNFSIWSDERSSFAVYPNGPETIVFPAMGGTDPTTALDDAIAHNTENRPHHLVFIMTDGEWYGLSSVEPWRTSREQQFMIVKWGMGPREIEGADEIVTLDRISNLPSLMERALDRMLAASQSA